MHTSAIISFDDVSFSYDEEQVLDHCSFEVPEGSHVVLKGASGSGKSTILKLILGFVRPQQGEIHYKGEILNPDRSRELRTSTAWLPAEVSLGEGAVQDIIRFPFEFKANGLGELQDDEKVLHFFEQLNLERELYYKPFRDLSTGQRQRIGIALCALLDKPLLLLDEPTSALDAAAQSQVADLLLANGNRTVISTSHDPVWLEHADHIYEL